MHGQTTLCSEVRVTESCLWTVAKGAQRAYAGCAAACACGLGTCLHGILRLESARLICRSEHQQMVLQRMEPTCDMAELLVLTTTALEAADAKDPVQQRVYLEQGQMSVGTSVLQLPTEQISIGN